MVTHREPSQSVQLTGTDSISEEAPVAERDGSVRAGVVSLRTRFWSMAFLQLLCRTRVELDGQRHVLAWGQLRVPVVAGWHQLRVSFRYLWMDCGAATKDFDVRGGHIVELTYRAPWLVFLRGKLRLSRRPAAGGTGDTKRSGWFSPAAQVEVEVRVAHGSLRWSPAAVVGWREVDASDLPFGEQGTQGLGRGRGRRHANRRLECGKRNCER